MPYTHFTLEERKYLQQLLSEDKSFREIAAILERSPSTICREVNRNKAKYKPKGKIFNKYLDEIVYFFQVTKVKLVIIEDLDRFGTPNIFLKLRELNQLINESKIVGRHITFIYAVKDDIFKDEERTKFFAAP